ncbi:MAG: hypothetical protein AAB650_00745 [Patescibacteria group bacterium]
MPEVQVESAPQFIDACRRIAERLNERVGSISIQFEDYEPALQDGDVIHTNFVYLRAMIAWRNEVFAELRCPSSSDVERKRGTIFFRDHPQKIYDHQYTEDRATRELPVLLRMHLARILKEEERVRHAREALAKIEI